MPQTTVLVRYLMVHKILFDRFFARNSNPTWSQNPSESIKHWWQDAYHSWFIFHRFILPTSTLRPFNMMRFPWEKSVLFQRIAFRSWRFAVDIDVWPLLVPTWGPLPYQNPSQAFKTLISRSFNSLTHYCIKFFIDLWSMLEANLGPCGPLFRTKWRDPRGLPDLFCCIDGVSNFLGVLTASSPRFGSIREALGRHLFSL